VEVEVCVPESLALSSASVTASRPCHVFSPRHVERSMRMSYTALSCLLRVKVLWPILPGLSHLKFCELEEDLDQERVSHAACLSFPRMEPFEGPSLARLRASLRRSARLQWLCDGIKALRREGAAEQIARYVD
jgi:hypothetical protein